MRSLPFARFNLRRNPFGEPPPEDRDVLFVGEVGDWPDFLRGEVSMGEGRLSGEGGKARPLSFLQLLGPAGCGKSTLLGAVMARFPGSSLMAWCPVEGWPPIPASRIGPLFIDDGQAMGERLLANVLRFPTVVMATQKDLEAPFRQAGFRVRTVPVAERCSGHQLGEIVERRLEWARRAPGPIPEIHDGLGEALLRRYGHDLRTMLSHLYDRFQLLEVQE